MLAVYYYATAECFRQEATCPFHQTLGGTNFSQFVSSREIDGTMNGDTVLKQGTKLSNLYAVTADKAEGVIIGFFHGAHLKTLIILADYRYKCFVGPVGEASCKFKEVG